MARTRVAVGARQPTGGEQVPNVGLHGQQPDVLDRFAAAVGAVHAATTLSLSDPLPVGGRVTGAGEALRLHERLQQRDLDRVTGGPVRGQTAR